MAVYNTSSLSSQISTSDNDHDDGNDATTHNYLNICDGTERSSNGQIVTKQNSRFHLSTHKAQIDHLQLFFLCFVFHLCGSFCRCCFSQFPLKIPKPMRNLDLPS